MTNQEKITQEIENLGSSQFERLCYILVTAISGMELIHRGTDSRGQPDVYKRQLFELLGVTISDDYLY